METLHTLERCHSKVDEVSHVEGNRSPIGIGITLLSRLGCLQAIPNELDLFLGLLNDVRAKDLAFSYFGPVKRGTALASVESFKGGHLQTSLVAIVIGELGEWQTVFPLGSIR
jgi:hypothetical protein